jgi:redox-sensitive bicupin YhaK (pirin superfamily)
VQTTAFTAATNERQIAGVYSAPEPHWVGDGFRVAGYFSHIPRAMQRLNPFLLLDYHPAYEYAPSERPRGVGVHPHRGFETVTIAWEGSVAHHDSAGGHGVIGPGDVQWMTAASGILHKEYHEPNFARQGGRFRMAQLWVNLPKAAKMGPPRYQPLSAEQMGRVDLPNGAGRVRVIAGDYSGTRGPAQTFSEMNVFDVSLSAAGSTELPIPSTHHLAVLVMQGEVTFNSRKAVSEDFVLFENKGQRVRVTAQSEAQLLVLSGVPIDEPIVQYGPFVMNSAREIAQAFEDYNSGKFGQLAD